MHNEGSPRYDGPRELAQSLTAFTYSSATGATWNREGLREDSEYRDLGLAAVAVIGAITTWNDYITVAVFAPDTAKRTLQVALVNQVFDAVGISWSFTMAFALIASLPVILMFLLVQKWFIAGLTAGAVKG